MSLSYLLRISQLYRPELHALKKKEDLACLQKKNDFKQDVFSKYFLQHLTVVLMIAWLTPTRTLRPMQIIKDLTMVLDDDGLLVIRIRFSQIPQLHEARVSQFKNFKSFEAELVCVQVVSIS